MLSQMANNEHGDVQFVFVAAVVIMDQCDRCSFFVVVVDQS
jgi:hypothetical protein